MPEYSPSEPANPVFFRDISVDVMRGLAIAIMILANMTPVLLILPASGWYRVIASLAAPPFVLISGMMIALSLSWKHRSLGYIAIRGGLVILVGAFVDIFILDWIPFFTMDVLYLIGLSLPCAYLYLKLPERKRWAIIITILCLTPVLQLVLGYQELAWEIPIETLWGAVTSQVAIPSGADIFKSWIIDGYFPIFPWLAFSLIGAEIGAYRWRSAPVAQFRFAAEGILGLCLLLAGGVFWALFPGPHYVRDGYVEFFYPPTLGFIVFALGFVILSLTLLDNGKSISRLDPLKAMGECALAIYIFQYAIIQKVIDPFDVKVPILSYIAVYLVFFAGAILFAYGLRKVRKSWRNQPFLVRFLIGG